MANARIRSLTYAGVAAVLAAIVAGCGGNSVTVAACSTPAGMQASLIYPAPGSTGIPDNVSQVIIATNSTLPSDWQVGYGWNVLLAYAYSGAYGSGHYGAEFVAASPSPLPSPAATPGFAGPYQYWSSTIPYGGVSAIPNLPPATAITVELNDSNSNCYPGVAIGGFTSQ
jgi:hypothetical protein